MSFRLSPGTLDELAGVYAPPKQRRSGSGGGKGRGAKAGGALAALLLPRSGTASTDQRPGPQAKQAFQGGTHMAATRGAIMTMERTSRGVPEVMVRITGRQHGAGHVLANFSYISRLGHGSDKELALHTSEGDVLRDGRDMQELAQDWHEWEMGGGARRAGATSISMILSVPTGTDPERLQEAALAFAREEFANRSWVASLHVDRDHPHVHLTFARRDLDGRRFHPDRDDLFRYRQRFAQKLRDRGIEANATPARARGIDPTHEPIAARKVREKGEVPRIDRSRAERVRRLREQGVPDPAQAALAKRQATVRATFERSLAELSASPSLANRIVVENVKRFVEAMPMPEPNSVRAVRLQEAFRTPSSVEPRVEPMVNDRLAAAIARSRAVSEEGRQATERLVALGRDRGTASTRSQADPSGHARSPVKEGKQQLARYDTGALDEILRQVLDRERERAQREHDRSRDRGGPRR